MRLHSLRITAFGPFGGTEAVDFDALGADGLFLLHGPTGAGKTTVLDAVAFALFGVLPGARQDADGRRLVSDHAPPGAKPRVELELSVGGTRLRVARSPEYERAKKRGAGTTREPARATLTVDDGSEGAARPDEVGREIARRLGMNADQFFQVALLPQGAFATFLRAETADRAALLERLFDTRRFLDAERWLAAHRREHAAAVDAGLQEVRVLAGRLHTASADDDAPPDDPTALGQWAQSLVGAARRARTGTATALAAATAAAGTAREAHARAQRHRGVIGRRERARAQLAEVERGWAEQQGWAAELDAAGRAADIAGTLDHVDELREQVRAQAHAAQRLAGLVAADREGAQALAAERRGESPLAESLAALRSEIGQLIELTTLATTTDADAAALGRSLRRTEEVEGEAAALAAARATLPARVAAAHEAVTDARRAADLVPTRLDNARRAGEVAAAAESVAGLRDAATAAEDAHRGAVAHHQRVTSHWLDLREQRLAGMAAELAGALRPGTSCAVCGSVEHPRPARAGAAGVGAEEERTAHAAERAADTWATAAGQASTDARRELDAALVRSAGLGADVATKALADARLAHAAATTTAARLPVAQARADELAAQERGLAAREQEYRADLATLTTEVTGLTARVAAARVRLDAARGDDPDVPARRARLQALTAEIARLLDARAEEATAQRHVDSLRERACAQALATGFDPADPVGAVLEARRDAERVTLLAGRLEAVRAARVGAQAVLAEDEVAALGGLSAEDADVELHRADAARARADEQLAEAQGDAATAAARADTVTDVAARLTDRSAALDPQVRQAREIAALADVVAGGGQNTRRMSLHSYVLAARLEEVAAAASLRLRKMSGGRYELLHSDAAGPHGRRGGLGLDVLDDHTGVVRSTKTLSGGESFLASLSLALGLADVVAAEAGGVALDTLFIDEGFGSLDPATLEEVIAVLDELRAGGRVVGIVSHVDELRQRIPNRINVNAGRSGSHLTVCAG